MVDTVRYVRKPFFIDAVQVTDANMADVATWCNGEIRTEGNASYIKVRVHRPANERQTRAFVGDWVLYAGTGYKVYMNKPFHRSFDLATTPSQPSEELRTTDVPADGAPALPRGKTTEVPADPVPTFTS